jgi:site-specific DNA-cytosine methylase
MKVLELFSGTHSVGKVCNQLGYEVISLDLKNADINCNILDWDYTKYPKGHFDIIWASPPCDTFSQLRNSWIGRGQTAISILNDINNIGLPILRRTEEIIEYFNPALWFIENPQTGKMKNYISKPFYDVDYCKYSNWGYRKRTRIWTNKKGFNNKLCNKDCVNISNGKHNKDISRDISRINERYRIPESLIKELLE